MPLSYYKAVNFNGSSGYADCGHIHIGDNLSVVAWVNCDSLATSRSMVLNGGNLAPDLSWYAGIHHNDPRRVRFYVSSDGTFTSGTTKYYVSPVASLPASGEAMVAFTWATGALKLYINGVEVVALKAWDPVFTTIFDPAGNLNLGGKAGTVLPWNDWICNVSLWSDTVLSAADVATFCSGGFNMDPRDLTTGATLEHSWIWDEELTYPLLPDHVGGNPGILTGMDQSCIIDSPWLVPITPRVYIHNRARRLSDGEVVGWRSINEADPTMSFHPDLLNPADYTDFVVIGRSWI